MVRKDNGAIWSLVPPVVTPGVSQNNRPLQTNGGTHNAPVPAVPSRQASHHRSAYLGALCRDHADDKWPVILAETTEQFVPRQQLIGTPKAINQTHTLPGASGTEAPQPLRSCAHPFWEEVYLAHSFGNVLVPAP